MSFNKNTPKEAPPESVNLQNRIHNYSLAATGDAVSTTDHITASTIPEPAKAADENAQAVVEAKNNNDQ
ncbi:hypothetical protein ABES02_06200 [Neobacillus pocheonensis]|uniref:hypothetical protein n=1 Tax=Neobacillus pocheonensis TaxID=363869 RepID=UPI003D2B2AEF